MLCYVCIIHIHTHTHIYTHTYIYILYTHGTSQRDGSLFAMDALTSWMICSNGPISWVTLWKDPPFFKGESTISMAIFTSNVKWVWVKIRYPNNWMVNTKLD